MVSPTVSFSLLGLLGFVAAAQVQLGKTTLKGRDVPLLSQEFFGGIPYAEPPIAELRLKPPVPKFDLDSTSFDASNFGLDCLQLGKAPAQVSEDCLTINVFRPSGISKNASLPVLFWTYGGAFERGGATTYNGSAIVAQSILRGTPLIYVNFNYRLGPLGFPQGAEAERKGILNLALKDQLAALKWVQHNIGAFGGDKQKVTIFGQSAGSIMSSILFLNSPITKLARAAIFQSGQAATSTVFNAERREVHWQDFVSGVGSCAHLAKSRRTVSCLREASSSTLLQGFAAAANKTMESIPWDPVLDGPQGLYPDLPSRLVKKGHFAKLPFISGTVLDEGTGFFALQNNYTEEVIRTSLIVNVTPALVSARVVEKSIDRLLKLYPDNPALGSPFNTGNETFGLSPGFKRIAAIGGDVSFQSQRRWWSQTASKARVNNWGYLFTQSPPISSPFGVFHGSEVSFVYGAPSDTSASARRLSSIMTDYWISFATSLDPNDGKGIQKPLWQKYTKRNEVIMQFNGENTTIIPDDYRKKQIDFINDAPIVYHHRRAV